MKCGSLPICRGRFVVFRTECGAHHLFRLGEHLIQDGSETRVPSGDTKKAAIFGWRPFRIYRQL